MHTIPLYINPIARVPKNNGKGNSKDIANFNKRKKESKGIPTDLLTKIIGKAFMENNDQFGTNYE